MSPSPMLTRQQREQVASRGPAKAEGTPKSTSGSAELLVSSQLKALEERLKANTREEFRLSEERLRQHTDTLFNTLSSNFTNNFSKIEREVAAINDKLSVELSALESKLNTKIESDTNSINCCIAELNNKIVLIDAELRDLSRLKAEVEVLKVEGHIKAAEKDYTSDAILFGLPFTDGENLKSIFNQICRSIDLLAPQVRDIFRPKPSIQHPNSAIIIKFYSPFDRSRVLKGFAGYRKRARAAVTLRGAGFDLDSKILIFESLSREARKILQAGIKLKRARKIFNVFSIRGVVQVRINRGDASIAVHSEAELDSLAANKCLVVNV